MTMLLERTVCTCGRDFVAVEAHESMGQLADHVRQYIESEEGIHEFAFAEAVRRDTSEAINMIETLTDGMPEDRMVRTIRYMADMTHRAYHVSERTEWWLCTRSTCLAALQAVGIERGRGIAETKDRDA